MPTINERPLVPAKTVGGAATVEGGNALAGAGAGALMVSILRNTLGDKLPWGPGEDVFVAGALTALFAAASKAIRKYLENKAVAH